MMKRALLIVTLLLAPATASAGEPEIRAAVEAGVPAGLGIAALEVPKDLIKASGTPEVRWARPARAGWSSVEITVVHKKKVKKGWVRVRLGELRPVLVTTRALRAGAVVTARDLAVGDRPEEGLSVAASAVTGVKITRDLAAGAVVTEADLALPPPLRRGAEVEVVVRRGNLVVTTRGTLEREARIGGDAAVRLATTRTVQRGRLINGSTVELGASR